MSVHTTAFIMTCWPAADHTWHSKPDTLPGLLILIQWSGSQKLAAESWPLFPVFESTYSSFADNLDKVIHDIASLLISVLFCGWQVWSTKYVCIPIFVKNKNKENSLLYLHSMVFLQLKTAYIFSSKTMTLFCHKSDNSKNLLLFCSKNVTRTL